MFNDVFLTPYPGDHGITKGCCAYGLLGNRYSTSSSASLVSLISSEADDEVKERDDLDNDNANDKDKDKDSDHTATTTTTSKMTTTKGKDLPPPPTPLWDSHLYPYLGPSQTNIEMAEVILAASLWIDIKIFCRPQIDAA